MGQISGMMGKGGVIEDEEMMVGMWERLESDGV